MCQKSYPCLYEQLDMLILQCYYFISLGVRLLLAARMFYDGFRDDETGLEMQGWLKVVHYPIGYGAIRLLPLRGKATLSKTVTLFIPRRGEAPWRP